MPRSIAALAVSLLISAPLFATKIVLVVGGGDGKDGTVATKAKIITPFGVDFDSKGRLFFVEFEKGERIRMIDNDNLVKTVAGSGEKGFAGDYGPANAAKFNGMHGLIILADDTVLIADTWNQRIRSYIPKGNEIIPFAGTGTKGFAGDSGPALKAQFGSIISIARSPGNDCVYIADIDNHRIRGISLTPMNYLSVNTIAGNGKKGVPADGRKAIDEPLLDPRACAMDTVGKLYILERSGHCLRVVNKDGIIKTVMGTGKAGTAIGKALESQMNGPKHLCIDKDNTVIIADSENHRILRYIPKEEKVAVIAGTGKKGSAGLDGDPLKCELNRPHGVCVHPKTGELYICDSYNDRILKIIP